jgi:sirohydrochlorin ferrochelatase
MDADKTRTGIVVFAHGSSVASANDAVRVVAAEAASSGGFDVYEVAFLDALPNLRDAVGRLVELGVSRVLVVPYFLTLGIHLKRDLPAMVGELLKEHVGLEIRVAPPLDGHPGLSRILADRAQEALSE